ncbi:hypothetical protein P872_11025 [Rhodonellum psychrophilum GCM71 = DSM 17998]|uniref:Uncharacterized protein n=1 Tax=Rhodonellum psychrophilum GCM71 = DSM 17998 TaxID=1123057 RepID=U5BSP7_9BACT|nr:hypothetical protein P872_11025 [Rhodonellum psychrophilum GCM71 = DSM 17998]
MTVSGFHADCLLLLFRWKKLDGPFLKNLKSTLIWQLP